MSEFQKYKIEDKKDSSCVFFVDRSFSSARDQAYSYLERNGKDRFNLYMRNMNKFQIGPMWVPIN